VRQRDCASGRWWRAAPLAPGILVLLGAAALPRPNDIPPRRHVVEIEGMAFHPAVMEVAPGDTVIWLNRDIVPHTATGDGKPVWSTGVLAREQSGIYVPRQSGSSTYFCELHPVMKGKLIIR
jgi:plastocyanin